MTIIELDAYRKPEPGNGALEALLEIISDAVDATEARDVADVLIAQLWMSGFKIVPLEE